MSESKSPRLSDDIESVYSNTSNQIRESDRRAYLRSNLAPALKLLVVVPMVAAAAEGLRWAMGGPSWLHIPLPIWIIFTIAFPAVCLIIRMKSRDDSVSRHRALWAADEKLGSSERIVTADHFLNQEQRGGFAEAAVEDAADWVRRGRDTRLDPSPAPLGTFFRSLWSIPVAIAALLLAGFLAQFSPATVGPDPESPDSNRVAVDTTIAPTEPKPKKKPAVKEEDPPREQPKSPPEKRKQRMAERQGSAGAAIPKNAEESQGKLNEGETKESQQSANPSSARGAPSASGQPSKAGDEKKPKPKRKQVKKPEKEREKKERPEEEKPSGATAGQGSSKGSDNNAAPSDWASSSQAATPDDEDVEDEDEVDDEEEEQESRGGVQPNLRDRRAPVNRDLQIGFGTNQPNPDANGRGGPGAQKKSRGVASLILGVPIPDRVNGQPNKGRIRITQQRITPEAEQSDAVNAQDRMARDGTVGPIHHPAFSPWLHDLVRRYFLERRAKHPLKTSNDDESATSLTSQDPLQTNVVAESDTPQS